MYPLVPATTIPVNSYHNYRRNIIIYFGWLKSISFLSMLPVCAEEAILTGILFQLLIHLRPLLCFLKFPRE
jgi:hypothetical protein